MPKYTGTETLTYLEVKASDVEKPTGGGLTASPTHLLLEVTSRYMSVGEPD